MYLPPSFRRMRPFVGTYLTPKWNTLNALSLPHNNRNRYDTFSSDSDGTPKARCYASPRVRADFHTMAINNDPFFFFVEHETAHTRSLAFF